MPKIHIAINEKLNLNKSISKVATVFNSNDFNYLPSHPIETIIVTTFFACVASCETLDEVCAFTNDNYDWLSNYYYLRDERMPLTNTIRKVLSLLPTQAIKEQLRITLLRSFELIKRQYNKKLQSRLKDELINRGFLYINSISNFPRKLNKYSDRISFDANDGYIAFSIAYETEKEKAFNKFLNILDLKETTLVTSFDLLDQESLNLIEAKNINYFIESNKQIFKNSFKTDFNNKTYYTNLKDFKFVLECLDKHQENLLIPLLEFDEGIAEKYDKKALTNFNYIKGVYEKIKNYCTDYEIKEIKRAHKHKALSQLIALIHQLDIKEIEGLI